MPIGLSLPVLFRVFKRAASAACDAFDARSITGFEAISTEVMTWLSAKEQNVTRQCCLTGFLKKIREMDRSKKQNTFAIKKPVFPQLFHEIGELY